MLQCAAFLERVRSDIRNQTAGIVRLESAGRDGILVVRSTADTGEMVLEAWYDSLSVWRDGPEGRLTPDTDGLLGGRWRGRLAGDGRFRVSAMPFVPDEVAEIVELAGVLDDFLPRLPTTPLRPGQAVDAGTARSIRRLADGPQGARRYAWTTRPLTDTTSIQQDTLSIPLERRVVEVGSMEWDPVRGPLRWERQLTLTARVDPKGPIRKAIHSVVNQRVRVERLPGAVQCGKVDFGSAPK
jgi:hypothetical protein